MTTETEATELEKLEKSLEEKPRALFSLQIVIGLVILSLCGGMLGSYLFLSYYAASDSENNLIGNIVSNVTIDESSAIISVAEEVSPAVVSITGVSVQQTFFGGTTESESSGTGFIVSSEGLIVTNKHVVADSADYTVYTSDGNEYAAEIMATDPLFDIAILKIDATGLPTVELGSTDSLKVGQTVVAIGNALGQYQNSVTTGIISGIGRVIQASDSTGTETENLDNVIQTDAAINLGNSGGPLLNIEGQVIGVNTAIDESGDSIGFAIPVDLIISALESYYESGEIVRPMLGVSYVSLNSELANSYNLSVDEGAYIYSNSSSSAIVSGSAADAAGLKGGDIITAINGEKISGTKTLTTLISQYGVGDEVTITYIRDGAEKTATATLIKYNS